MNLNGFSTGYLGPYLCRILRISIHLHSGQLAEKSTSVLLSEILSASVGYQHEKKGKPKHIALKIKTISIKLHTTLN